VLIVVGVGADEKPDYLIISLANTDRSIRIGNANRPKRKRDIETFELQGWMKWIGYKSPVGLSSAVLNFSRKPIKIAAKR
jgi:hypothetical protein